ncbi:DUF2231 domain-containing protein [Micromonospora sp. HM5-17]|nr:DUF2231 domain-containing protein [Micromonospora sp. HM5-17]
MQSRLRVHGHPIQPMLVTFPFGLFVSATVFDLADLLGGPAILGLVGYWTAVAALVAAGLTVVAGLVDLWDVPGDRTRRTALTFNLVIAGVAVLFVVACLIRSGTPEHGATGALLAVELVGLALGTVGVRLGGILVRHFDPPTRDPRGLDVFGSGSVARGFGRRRGG